MNVSIHWFDTEEHIQNVNLPGTIIFKVDRKQPVFYCQAINDWGWKSKKIFYNMSVLFPGRVKTFTAEGVSGTLSSTSFIINQDSNPHLYCEVEGNPSPLLKLFNDQSLLIETINSSVKIIYNMSCLSSTFFMCTSEIANEYTKKTITIFKECPFHLTETPINQTLLINSKSNTTVYITLYISGYPNPKRYSVLRNESLLVNFDVSDEEVFSLGYKISYQSNILPYGIVNLSFVVEDTIYSANYVFVIDNGIIPALNYSFSIQRENLETDSTYELTSKSILQPSLVYLGTCLAAVIVICIIVFVGHFYRLKVKVPCNKTESPSKSSSDLYESITYEEIELSYESNSNLINNAGNQAIAGRTQYDIIDESLVTDNDTTLNVRTNQYDEMAETSTVDYHKYHRLRRLINWDDDYITVIDEIKLENNEYITLLDEDELVENEYVTATEEIIQHHNDYVNVLYMIESGPFSTDLKTI